MTEHNMRHMEFLTAVADADVAVLREKEATYQGSWKRAGGSSAWFMFRRNMDRLIEMMKPPALPDAGFNPQNVSDLAENIENSTMVGGREFRVQFHTSPGNYASFLRFLLDERVSENIFRGIEAAPGGEDGTVLACLRDLRRYAMLIEAEMMSVGVVPHDKKGKIGRKVPRRDPDEVLGASGQGEIGMLPPLFSYIDIVVQRGPGPDCSIIEVHDSGGRGISLGEWVDVPGGYPALRLSTMIDGRSTLDRGAAIEADFYRLKAFEWGVEQATARNMITKAIDGLMDRRVEPAKPFDPILSAEEPWVMSKSRFSALGMGRMDATRVAAYVERGENSMLEPCLDNSCMAALRNQRCNVVALAVERCYVEVLDDVHVLRIKDAPEAWRVSWPVLRTELNEKERSDGPAWCKELYSWVDAETKWRIKPEWRDWCAQ